MAATAPTLRPIEVLHLSADEYDSLIARPFVAERLGDVPLLVVEGDGESIADPGSLPVVVCSSGAALGAEGPAHADLVVDDAHLDPLVDRVSANPLAAITLALVLRTAPHLPVDHALAVESAAYSMLQGSEEFGRWRGAVDAVLDEQDEAAVLLERHGDELRITLNRPHRHNAITRQLRDELCAALTVAEADGTIASVQLAGDGPSFCSGGDLDEFGARPDPALAHATRLAQSPARLIHRLRARTTVRIHGTTLGGGIEMAAFAGRIIAAPGTRIGLPEVGLGLIPGAGGTVSITNRIGRQRTAALGLAVGSIDAPTALDWGLVDEIGE